MQFSVVAAITAFAAVVSANGNHTASPVWVTEVVTSLTTVCPEATTFSHNGVTYTATESETITITNCPCTVSKPVYTTSAVICSTCSASATPATSIETTVTGTNPIWSAPTTGYHNSTAAGTTVASSVVPSGGSVGTSAAGSSAPSSTAPIAANSGNRVFTFSGASLAGLLAVAAYVL